MCIVSLLLHTSIIIVFTLLLLLLSVIIAILSSAAATGRRTQHTLRPPSYDLVKKKKTLGFRKRSWVVMLRGGESDRCYRTSCIHTYIVVAKSTKGLGDRRDSNSIFFRSLRHPDRNKSPSSYFFFKKKKKKYLLSKNSTIIHICLHTYTLTHSIPRE